MMKKEGRFDGVTSDPGKHYEASLVMQWCVCQ